MYRYVIYGAGGVGSLLGGRLARADERVLLVGRAAHVERINADGLRIVETDCSVTVVRVAAATTPLEPGPDDVVVLTVKCYDTRTALAELRHYYGRETPIVCLQNGIRNELAARRAFRRVYGGLNVIGAQYLTPGQVEALGSCLLAIGVYPHGVDALAEEFVAAAVRAGLAASVHPNVMAPKWTKLVGNCHNAVFALCDMTVAAALNDPDGGALVQTLRDEAWAVLAAAGIAHEPIPNETRRRGDGATGRRGDASPVPMYGSTWMDFRLRRGKQEADYFNGEIVHLGRRHGVATPANEMILRLTREAARRRAPPGGHTLADLRELVRKASAAVHSTPT